MFADSDSPGGREPLQCLLECSTAGHKQSRKFLEYIDSNVLTQVIRESTRTDALLDLMCTNNEDLFGDMKAGATVQPAATMGW